MHAAAVARVQEVLMQLLGTADRWLYPNFTGAFQKPFYTNGLKNLKFSWTLPTGMTRMAHFRTLLPAASAWTDDACDSNELCEIQRRPRRDERT